MTVERVFENSDLTAKKKAKALGEGLVSGDLSLSQLLAFAKKKKASDLATCIEAIEYATKKEPTIANRNLLVFVTNALSDDVPRVKWESARVIGNIASQFPNQLKNSIDSLLLNAKHDGSVVRWAAAYALGEILKLDTKHNKELIPEVEELCKAENDDGARKKYAAGLKRAKKNM